MPSERDASVNDEEILANLTGRVLTLGIVASYVMSRVSFYRFSHRVWFLFVVSQSWLDGFTLPSTAARSAAPPVS